MKFAYVDASCLVAIALGETGWNTLSRRIASFDVIACHGLARAELWSACAREKLVAPDDLLDGFVEVVPPHGLAHEIARVLEAGYVRGADCWHLATALFLAPTPSDIVFLTLDERQRTVAKALGFKA